jgi:hypothetical protein
VRLTNSSKVGWDVFANFDLLGLDTLGGIIKDSSSSSPSVVKLISVERRDSTFVFLRFAVFADFTCPLFALMSSKRRAKDFFLGAALASK